MLKLRRIALDTQRENVALIARDCAAYRAEDFRALSRIEVANGERRLLASLVISEEPGLIAPDELGLSQQAFAELGVPEGTPVTIAHASPPRSVGAIRAKIEGRVLTSEQIEGVVRDVAARRYSEMEIAAFLVATAAFVTAEEVLALTRAMARVGSRLDWASPLVVDKHSIGGIPGNRTSMIVVPIVAAHGLLMPKTSSRAITSPAGTADTMELLAKVDLTGPQMRAVVDRTRACLVWGGHVNLSPADDILIAVERPLGIDTQGQMVASILSKKLAAGSTHLVIDLPVGPTAKLRSPAEAIRLRKLIEYIGHEVGLVVDVVATDGTQPVGRGVGPVLEVRDVLAVLRGEADAPADLREKSLLLAGHILEFDPALRGGTGIARARQLLESGAALAAMERIIAAQGAQPAMPPPGPLVEEVRATATGRVAAIDCFRIARTARLAGAPTDKGAGIDLLRKVGDPVAAGEPLYRIHACVPSAFHFACEHARHRDGYTIEEIAA